MTVFAEESRRKAEINNNSKPYPVVAGDTFSKIALRNKISMDELHKLNSDIENISRIKVGQIINVPKETPADVAVAQVGKKPVQNTVVASTPDSNKLTSQGMEAKMQNKSYKDQLTDANKRLKDALADIEKFANNKNAYTDYRNDPNFMGRSIRARDIADADIKRLEPLVATEAQVEKIAKANAEKIAQAVNEYAALSPNERILKDYQKALSAAQAQSNILSADPYGKSKEEVNRIFDTRKSIAGTINELQTKISTCRTLIETDKEIKSITNETAVARARLRQT